VIEQDLRAATRDDLLDEARGKVADVDHDRDGGVCPRGERLGEEGVDVKGWRLCHRLILRFLATRRVPVCRWPDRSGIEKRRRPSRT
jgi:hypothetical protein